MPGDDLLDPETEASIERGLEAARAEHAALKVSVTCGHGVALDEDCEACVYENRLADS